MDVRALKHRAQLQEWSIRIRECRNSGKTVLSWCAENDIKPKTYYYWEKAILREMSGRGTEEPRTALVRIQPEQMRSSAISSAVNMTIQCGSTAIELPVSTPVEIIAELVQALNRHA